MEVNVWEKMNGLMGVMRCVRIRVGFKIYLFSRCFYIGEYGKVRLVCLWDFIVRREINCRIIWCRYFDLVLFNVCYRSCISGWIKDICWRSYWNFCLGSWWVLIYCILFNWVRCDIFFYVFCRLLGCFWGWSLYWICIVRWLLFWRIVLSLLCSSYRFLLLLLVCLVKILFIMNNILYE